MGRASDTKGVPRAQIQKDVIANAEILEKNVMVTDRLISPRKDISTSDIEDSLLTPQHCSPEVRSHPTRTAA